MSNKELAEEFHIQKRKVYLSFIDNIRGADLNDMQLISKFNKAILFYYVIDVLSKYAWVIPFKDRKNIIITHAFQKFLYESIRQ